MPFVEAVHRAGLDEYESQLTEAVAESIFITTEASPQESFPIGASRIGGLPDLPAELEWPSADDTPLAFLAQFNLDELRKFDTRTLLPESGFLFFFYDGDQRAWGFDPKDQQYWRVVFHPGSASDLARREAPVSLPEEHVFSACALQLSLQQTLPQDSPFATASDKYSMLLELLGTTSTHHQLLGHESTIQGDVKLECQLVSNGLYRGDSSGYGDPRATQLEAGANEWMLLFQADSDDSPKMMWGDLGRLYFCIREQDLKNCRFENVWMIFQCY
jgi:uncharacterized protein YwqG